VALSACTGSLHRSCEVVAAAVLGWVFLNEPLAPLQWLGAAVVILGVVVARKGSRP